MTSGPGKVKPYAQLLRLAALQVAGEAFPLSRKKMFVWFDALHPSQQLWSCWNGQFT